MRVEKVYPQTVVCDSRREGRVSIKMILVYFYLPCGHRWYSKGHTQCDAGRQKPTRDAVGEDDLWGCLFGWH